MTDYQGRASVKRKGGVVEYESSDGVSTQTATFRAKNDQKLPSLATHWLNDGDHIVFLSREAAIDFLEKALATMRGKKDGGK